MMDSVPPAPPASAPPRPPPPRPKQTKKKALIRTDGVRHSIDDFCFQVMKQFMIRCEAEMSPFRIEKKPHRNKRGGQEKREKKKIQMQSRAAALTIHALTVLNSAATSVGMIGPPREDEVHADAPAMSANVVPFGVVPVAEPLTVSSPEAEMQMSSDFSQLCLSDARESPATK